MAWWKQICIVALCLCATVEGVSAHHDSKTFFAKLDAHVDILGISRDEFNPPVDTIDDYDKYYGTWISDLSPWHPYLRQQFSAGLKPKQRTEHNKLIKAYRCEEAAKFEKIGFLRLYPELRDIFSDPFVSRMFDISIVPQVSYSDRWCRAMRMLEPIAKKAVQSQKLALEIVGKPGDIDIDGTIEDPTLTMVFAGWFVLERLALCDNYQPAIASLLKHFDEFAYAELGRASALYLLYLSKKMGIEDKDFEEKLDDVKKYVTSAEMIHIEGAFRDYPIKQSLALLPYQSQACKISITSWPKRKLYP